MSDQTTPKSEGEKAWEKAQADIERHDREFEAKHGKDAGKPGRSS